jgi:hypothetical protein
VDGGARRLLCHELRIDPRPVVSTQAADQDGNVVAHAWFEEPASALEVESRFNVETLREKSVRFSGGRRTASHGAGRLPGAPALDSRAVPGAAARAASVGDFVQAAEAAAWKTSRF